MIRILSLRFMRSRGGDRAPRRVRIGASFGCVVTGKERRTWARRRGTNRITDQLLQGAGVK